MKTLKLILILSFLVLFNLNSKGYSQFVDLGGYLTLVVPQGEFADYLKNMGGGFNGHFLWYPNRNVPFSVGLSVGYYMYGHESRRERWSTTIPDAFLTVTRSNNILGFHLLFQVSPSKGDFKPYIEGLVGGNYFYTSTSVKSDYQDKELTSSTNFDDWAWSYGGGAGMMIRLYTGKTESESKFSIYLDLKGRYLYGSKAQYLKEGDTKIENGYVKYYPSKSKTDLLHVMLGVTVMFSSAD